MTFVKIVSNGDYANPKVVEETRGDTFSRLRSYIGSEVSIKRGRFYVEAENEQRDLVVIPYDQENQPIRTDTVFYVENVFPKPKSPNYNTGKLEDAVRYNRTGEVLQLLEEGADVGIDGDPLLDAIEKDNADIFEALVNHGMEIFFRASIFYGEIFGRTSNARIHEALLKAGAEFDNSSAITAILRGDSFLVSYFLKQNTDIVARTPIQRMKTGTLYLVCMNSLDKNNNTALHYAAEKGDIEICDLILMSGVVDKNKRNFSGKTAADIARKNGFEDVAKHIECF